MKYKIGITSLGYQCIEHLDKVFAPWRKVKQGALSNVIEEVHIGTAHGCFNETAAIGFPLYSTDGTIEKFQKLHKEGVIDYLNVFDHNKFEYQFWNSNLDFLFSKNIDLLFMLNMDEVWELEEIERSLNFISENPDISWFNTHFKNYVFDFNSYVKTFIVPRWWRNDKNEGILGFHFDDELTFKNGLKYKECLGKTIPFEISSPKHYSWVSNIDGYLKRKCDFQNKHYGACSYKWDEETKKLYFSEHYYQMMGQMIPMVYKDS